MINRINYIAIFFLLVLLSCSKKTEKDKWINESYEIKYSKEREKEVWGKILRGYDKEIFYGTPVYDVATQIEGGNHKKLADIISKLSKEEINYTDDKFNKTLGGFALRHGNLKAIKVLIENGLNPNILENDGASLITSINSYHNSRLPNSLETLEFIIKNGGNVNLLNDKKGTLDRTPLIVACSGSNLANVKMLIKHGADPHFIYENIPGDRFPESAFIKASGSKAIDIVNYLIFEQKVDYSSKHSLDSKWNPGGYKILSYLRKMMFPLDSERYEQKMKLVKYLSKQGMDYWSTPIPDYLKKGRTEEYLSKY